MWCGLYEGAESFENALERVIRLGGDTDTGGAIVGQILGALYGYKALPCGLVNQIHDLDLILRVADDFYRTWEDRSN